MMMTMMTIIIIIIMAMMMTTNFENQQKDNFPNIQRYIEKALSCNEPLYKLHITTIKKIIKNPNHPKIYIDIKKW